MLWDQMIGLHVVEPCIRSLVALTTALDQVPSVLATTQNSQAMQLSSQTPSWWFCDGVHVLGRVLGANDTS